MCGRCTVEPHKSRRSFRRTSLVRLSTGSVPNYVATNTSNTATVCYFGDEFNRIQDLRIWKLGSSLGLREGKNGHRTTG